MTSSSGGSHRGPAPRKAADSSDMNSNSPTAAGSYSVSMARSTTSMPTARRRTPGRLTIRSGRTTRSGSGCTPRPPPSHRKVAASRERNHRARRKAVGERPREVTGGCRRRDDRRTGPQRPLRLAVSSVPPRGLRHSGSESRKARHDGFIVRDSGQRAGFNGGSLPLVELASEDAHVLLIFGRANGRACDGHHRLAAGQEELRSRPAFHGERKE